ncbi:MAG TPA: class I SAM-dependent methyltransferase [Candidatus Coprenecus stercoravium]|uniref:Class I SAM-dependent methyltransferase n=1 Tax=Candidatus Coprenecus stercoravium TaxID=2840735 RepID=A0A9D2K9J5_9BACT|nr:class I SAM-dependent methyltransferase [Candidatus Coprenecus stercoravium]
MTELSLRKFILEHGTDSPEELMLHRDRWPDIDMAVAVRCIRGRQTARHKLPLWYDEPGLLYPQSLSLEQCSSQATALYKQRFVRTGDKVADLTGGLGVDTWSLSQVAASADYFERSEELCECAAHNFRILGRDNITVRNALTDSVMLGGIPSDSYNLIYIDPARRGKDGGRVYSLRDCEPDITALRHELLRIAPRILLKASPMADIRILLSELPEAAEVRIVSHNNECKEVLVLMQRGHSASPEEIPIAAVEILDDNAVLTAEFHFTLREEREAAAETVLPQEIKGYLYEPSTALLKSGAFKLPAVRHGLRKISASTHFYVGSSAIEGFPGKIRSIVDVLPFNKAAIKDFKSKYPSCSVTARNFPMTSEALRKRLGATESDSLRVLATTASDGSRLLIVSKPIH